MIPFAQERSGKFYFNRVLCAVISPIHEIRGCRFFQPSFATFPTLGTRKSTNDQGFHMLS